MTLATITLHPLSTLSGSDRLLGPDDDMGLPLGKWKSRKTVRFLKKFFSAFEGKLKKKNLGFNRKKKIWASLETFVN